MSEWKTEKRNSQLEHGQPMEQTRGLFCTCDSGVARCQSQHQCSFWQMSSVFEAFCTGKWTWQLSIKFVEFMKLWTVSKIYRFIKGLLRKCKYLVIFTFSSKPLMNIYNFATELHNIWWTTAKLTCLCNSLQTSNLFARCDTGVVTDSEQHMSCTCKQASCLLDWLSVFTLAVPLFRFALQKNR